MTVTSVRIYKATTFEVEIDNDRKIYLHADIVYDFGIRKGMELDTPKLKEIIYKSNFRRAYQYALYCLDYRDYSAREIYNKILEKYKNEKLCHSVVEKLEECGIISDERYAEKLARKYIVGKKYGYSRARREILLKGINEYIAEDALMLYSGEIPENLAHLIETKYSRMLSDRTDRKSIEKVKNSLVRYGYNFEQINRAVEEYFDCQED